MAPRLGRLLRCPDAAKDGNRNGVIRIHRLRRQSLIGCSSYSLPLPGATSSNPRSYLPGPTCGWDSLLRRPGAVFSIAESRRTGTSEWVFAMSSRQPFKSIRTAFENACRRANLADVTPLRSGTHLQTAWACRAQGTGHSRPSGVGTDRRRFNGTRIGGRSA